MWSHEIFLLNISNEHEKNAQAAVPGWGGPACDAGKISPVLEFSSLNSWTSLGLQTKQRPRKLPSDTNKTCWKHSSAGLFSRKIYPLPLRPPLGFISVYQSFSDVVNNVLSDRSGRSACVSSCAGGPSTPEQTRLLSLSPGRGVRSSAEWPRSVPSAAAGQEGTAGRPSTACCHAPVISVWSRQPGTERHKWRLEHYGASGSGRVERTVSKLTCKARTENLLFFFS